MTISIEAVAKVIELNGGRLVGKTRLQKSFYMLEALGVGFGFEFSYHYYGPYSEELSLSTEFAEALKLVRSEVGQTAAGAPYVTYFGLGAQNEEEAGDQLRRRILQVLSNFGSIELELAATTEFLSRNGFNEDPWAETILRKSGKATPERISKAKALLSDVHHLIAN